MLQKRYVFAGMYVPVYNRNCILGSFVSALSNFGPESFRPGSFRPESFGPGSFRPNLVGRFGLIFN